ncbi:hypothetical protein AKO1_007047 [Acrasis kona]|uniref:DUF1697 domain-containing protein n=1 Tax=Acrasis kona TaxID=1008807 RepID=A0AAW2YSM2_9EUKA
MERYVVLLRGVNVGGINIKMVDVKELFKTLEFEKVETVLATGNIIFSDKNDTTCLKSMIERELRKKFKYDAWVVVLKMSTLEEIIENFPFEDDEDLHGYVIFTSKDGTLDELASLDGDDQRTQLFKDSDLDVLYWEVPKGQTTKSTVGKYLNKKKFKEHVTTRNLKTLKKILAKK